VTGEGGFSESESSIEFTSRIDRFCRKKAPRGIRVSMRMPVEGMLTVAEESIGH
jgi:hypothetical protein